MSRTRAAGAGTVGHLLRNAAAQDRPGVRVRRPPATAESAPLLTGSARPGPSPIRSPYRNWPGKQARIGRASISSASKRGRWRRVGPGAGDAAAPARHAGAGGPVPPASKKSSPTRETTGRALRFTEARPRRLFAK
jgi:hypothetical protein